MNMRRNLIEKNSQVWSKRIAKIRYCDISSIM